MRVCLDQQLGLNLFSVSLIFDKTVFSFFLFKKCAKN